METKFSYYEYNFTEGGLPVLSNTGMSHLAISPRHYIAFLKGERNKETKPLLLGKNIHTFILEPEKFNDMWQVKEPYNLDGKRNPAYAIQKERAEKGEIILIDEQKEFDNYLRLMNSLAKNDFFATIITAAGIYEGLEKDLTFQYRDIPCKARLDIIAPMAIIIQLDPLFKEKYKVTEDYIIMDLKTTQDARQSEFTRKAEYSYHYDRQLAWYENAVYQSGIATQDQTVATYILAVEKESPFESVLVKLSKNIIAKGKKKYDALCDRYIEAKAQAFDIGYTPYEWDCPEEQDYSELPTFDIADMNGIFAGFGLTVLTPLQTFEKDAKAHIDRAKTLEKLAELKQMLISIKRIKGDDSEPEAFNQVKQQLLSLIGFKQREIETVEQD